MRGHCAECEGAALHAESHHDLTVHSAAAAAVTCCCCCCAAVLCCAVLCRVLMVPCVCVPHSWCLPCWTNPCLSCHSTSTSCQVRSGWKQPQAICTSTCIYD